MLHKLCVEIEYLFLHFANRSFNLFPSGHHVSQITNLENTNHAIIEFYKTYILCYSHELQVKKIIISKIPLKKIKEKQPVHAQEFIVNTRLLTF